MSFVSSFFMFLYLKMRNVLRILIKFDEMKFTISKCLFTFISFSVQTWIHLCVDKTLSVPDNLMNVMFQYLIYILLSTELVKHNLGWVSLLYLTNLHLFDTNTVRLGKLHDIKEP